MATKRANRVIGKTERGQSLKQAKISTRLGGAAALVAALLVGAVPTAVQAEDVWTCTWPGFSSDHRPVLMRFKVQGDFLIEDNSLRTGEEPLSSSGSHLPESYRILQNNENAVIATMAIAAIPPGHSKLSILSRTFVIDKSTGELVWSNLTLGEPDSANKPVHGTCRVGHEG